MLIEPGSSWPPPGHARMRDRWQSWAAWWSGDLTMLRTSSPNTAPNGYWWRRQQKSDQTQLHLPLAADIARTSAELVAGDTPVMEWESGTQLQDAWDDVSQRLGWANTLLEASEIAAALGGVYLRPVWDTAAAAHPLVTVMRADEAMPVFRHGILQSVTFVTELAAPDGWKFNKDHDKWRWLEHHEPGVIRQELWLGTGTGIGRPVPLDEHPVTTGLSSELDTTFIRPGILVDYIPNDLPQPLDRQPLGRADIQGSETLLDALDETWDSWMRDIRLGKGRILVSSEFLDPIDPGKAGGLLGLWDKFKGGTGGTAAKAFDVDAEAFMPLAMPGEDAGKPAPITDVQFAIRFQEHGETVNALVEQVTSRAGYSPQTMGMHVEGQLSGTAMRRRAERSYRTRDRKRRYERPALERHAHTLMLINEKVFSGPAPGEQPPTLQWRETDQADPKETAETIELLRRAEVLSDEIAVKMAHPEWDDVQVDEEVGRLGKARQDRQAADPLTGFEPGPSTQDGSQKPDENA